MRKWKTRDGRKLELSCMTCEHLRNCLARIIRLNWRVEWLPYILAEIDRRCRDRTEEQKAKDDQDLHESIMESLETSGGPL